MSAQPIPELQGFADIGGHPALDLVNTVGWRPTQEPRDILVDVEALAAFAGVVGDADTAPQRLLDAAINDRAAATAGLERVRSTREALDRVFSVLARDDDPSDDALTDLAGRFGDAVVTARPTMTATRLTWLWHDAAPWDQLINDVLVAAVDLLTSGDAHRVKVCSETTCGWLFLDGSRNRSRRWCSMQVCGSRTKMRRHYKRRKAQEAPSQDPPRGS